ncbi:MAG: hypothetical protein AAFQ89_01570 [Cyanobacteria bacterium J06626_18]
MTETELNSKDTEQLKLIAILHYVLGGIVAASSLLALVHVGIGLSFILSPGAYPPSDGTGFPFEFGWLFFITGLTVLITGLILAICLVISGRCLAKRKGYWFSFVVACIECIYTPLGTALGVLTLIVLCRDSVKARYSIRQRS